MAAHVPDADGTGYGALFTVLARQLARGWPDHIDLQLSVETLSHNVLLREDVDKVRNSQIFKEARMLIPPRLLTLPFQSRTLATCGSSMAQGNGGSQAEQSLVAAEGANSTLINPLDCQDPARWGAVQLDPA